jgi:membrane-associated phospholipid phosphatase
MVIVIVITAFLTIFIAKLPYLPGDVFIARCIQSLLPANPGWAKWVTSFAFFPGYIILIAIAFFCSWSISGMKAAIFSLASFGGILVIDRLLRLIIFQPRPAPGLIHVASMSPGSAFPSTAAFVYAATFGYVCVLAVRKGAKFKINGVVLIVCVLGLVIAFAARIALGAHWPSDLIASYLWAYLWILFLMRYVKTQ